MVNEEEERNEWKSETGKKNDFYTQQQPTTKLTYYGD